MPPSALLSAPPEAAWTRAVQLLAAADEVALACHVDPDGDALGSMLALHHVLRRRGVRTVASFAGSPHGGLRIPPQYTFLPGVDQLAAPDAFPAAPPLLVTFDCASPQRLGTLAAAVDAAECVIVIDHHAAGESFGDVRLLDERAAATAVLVEQLLRRMGEPVDRDVAACLYTALVTDTGGFQYASTTPAVLELAARLIAFGIDHAAISQRVFATHSFGYVKVLARVLERATLVPAVGLAWTALHQRDLDELGVSLAETEGLIDVLRTVETAECSLVCKQQPDGTWKGSLRSRGRVDVSRVAAALGGGGHVFAAGFDAAGPLEAVVDRVVDALGAGAAEGA
jgi:phosphoesterase RecJ-like protein